MNKDNFSLFLGGEGCQTSDNLDISCFFTEMINNFSSAEHTIDSKLLLIKVF